LLAMPPLLVASRVDFFPELPKDLCASWSATDTWMAPHAKYFAIYEKPFWRDMGLSGQGRSRVGPMAEIHDASVPDGLAALFGFIAVPALVRRNMSDAQLKALCRAQLARMYGEQADSPVLELLQDWALEPFTATQADLTSAGRHVKPPKATVDSGLWAGRITGIASEWSPQFAGYLAGAVDAAANGVEALQLLASAERGASALCDTMQSNQPEQLSVTPE
jgi:monoamine oxidase